MVRNIQKNQLKEYCKVHPEFKEKSISYHKPKPDPKLVLTRKKLIYQYYKQYSKEGIKRREILKKIQQIFFNSSFNKLKEIIQEMEKYSIAHLTDKD